MTKTSIAFCIMATALCVLGSCKMRGISHVGQHRLEIAETYVWHAQSGRSNYTRLPDGKLIFTYESEKLKVRLEDEVLTVNGKRYVLVHKDDSIRITDGRVEINGQPAKAEDQQPPAQ